MAGEDKELTAEQVKSRAAVLCAMDCIMHHLNDENDIVGWLMNGVPDGGPFDVLDDTSPAERLDYYGQYTGDGEFEDFVKLFAKIIRYVCFAPAEYRPKGIT